LAKPYFDDLIRQFVRQSGLIVRLTSNRGRLQRSSCRLVAVKDVYSVMAVDWLCVEDVCSVIAVDWFWYLKKLKIHAKVVVIAQQIVRSRLITVSFAVWEN